MYRGLNGVAEEVCGHLTCAPLQIDQEANRKKMEARRKRLQEIEKKRRKKKGSESYSSELVFDPREAPIVGPDPDKIRKKNKVGRVFAVYMSGWVGGWVDAGCYLCCALVTDLVCSLQGGKWSDEEFAANDDALYRGEAGQRSRVTGWKRPEEIFEERKVFCGCFYFFYSFFGWTLSEA